MPGIDFTNDPLLQGRNFSYLDTQLKRLGGPNFTHIPINAPKCPFAHFQQDGHMAMRNPKGRVNYEPNSWGASRRAARVAGEGLPVLPGAGGGPEAARPLRDLRRPLQPGAAVLHQPDRRSSRGTSPTRLTFELSKVETPAIRARMVSHLLNIDDGLAEKVAEGLRLQRDAEAGRRRPADATGPEAVAGAEHPAERARELRGPQGRGAGHRRRRCRRSWRRWPTALKAEGAMLEARSRRRSAASRPATAPGIEADEKLEGGPSVLFDAVAILPSAEGAARLATLPAARDFVADAFAHRKFIAYVEAALPLLEKAGVAESLDDGFVPLKAAQDCEGFVARCRKLRFWDRPSPDR